jgi:hypothetical protein
MTPERKEEISELLRGTLLTDALAHVNAIQELLEDNISLTSQLSAANCTVEIQSRELQAEEYHADPNVPCPICDHLNFEETDKLLGEYIEKNEALEAELEELRYRLDSLEK